jgi:glucokinase
VRQQLAIGVDLGGTNLRCALVSPEGLVLMRESRPTELGEGPDPFLSGLIGLVTEMKRQAELAGLEVRAAGLALPGVISAEGVILESVNLGQLQGMNLAAAISSATGLRSVSVNDANAGAVAEHRFGAGKGFQSLLMVSIGTGIGAGLILGGRLWSGIDGASGELGHIPIDPEGPSCRCGSRGCLEQYASATAIARRAAERNLPGSAAALAALARQGDREAEAIFAEAGCYLGVAAATVVNLLNLEAIILGGGVSASFDLLAPPLRAELLARALAVPGGRVRVLKGELGDNAGLIGAAALAFDSVAARPDGVLR